MCMYVIWPIIHGRQGTNVVTPERLMLRSPGHFCRAYWGMVGLVSARIPKSGAKTVPQKPAPNAPRLRTYLAGGCGPGSQARGAGAAAPPAPLQAAEAAEGQPRQPPLGSQVSCNFCAAPPIYWLIPPPSSFPLPPSPFPPFSPSLVAYRGRSISSLRETEVGSLNDWESHHTYLDPYHLLLFPSFPILGHLLETQCHMRLCVIMGKDYDIH